MPRPQHNPGPPLVSVLLPFRDATATLGTALRSVARQSLADLECVIVDDGSVDRGPEQARALAAMDPRFCLVRNPGRGLVAALQHGLAHCRAPLVARMDADDLMHRDRLLLQAAELAARPELTGTGTHVRMFPGHAVGEGMRAYEQWIGSIRSPGDVDRNALVECPVVHPTWMVRTEAIRSLGYRDGDWPEDYELLLRSLARGDRWSVLPRRLHGWRRSDTSHSRKDPRYAVERFTACKAEHLARTFLRGAATYVLWGHGGTGRSLRAALEQHGLRPDHIVELHPGRVGQRIHGATVVHVDSVASMAPGRLVVSVSGATNRALIRAHLDALGWRESEHYVCTA